MPTTGASSSAGAAAATAKRAAMITCKVTHTLHRFRQRGSKLPTYEFHSGAGLVVGCRMNNCCSIRSFYSASAWVDRMRKSKDDETNVLLLHFDRLESGGQGR